MLKELHFSTMEYSRKAEHACSFFGGERCFCHHLEASDAKCLIGLNRLETSSLRQARQAPVGMLSRFRR